MKRLILVGGPMGVGKTAVCRALREMLEGNVFLDGDWCWDMRPFLVTDETKRMVMDNICGMLNRFLDSDAFENVIFCWVMHRQEIIDEILSRVNGAGEAYVFSLLASPDALSARIRADVDRGIRQSDVLARSLDYVKEYDALNSVKIDTTDMDPEAAARAILRNIAETPIR